LSGEIVAPVMNALCPRRCAGRWRSVHRGITTRSGRP
jgi:hypothetical protein